MDYRYAREGADKQRQRLLVGKVAAGALKHLPVSTVEGRMLFAGHYNQIFRTII